MWSRSVCAFSELSCLCVVNRNRKTQDSQTNTSASNSFEGGEIRKRSVNVLLWGFFFFSFNIIHWIQVWILCLSSYPYLMLAVETPTPQNQDSENLPTAFGIYSTLGLYAEQTDFGSSLRNEMKRGGYCRQAGSCWSALWKPVPDSRMVRGCCQAGLSPLLLMNGYKIIQTYPL